MVAVSGGLIFIGYQLLVYGWSQVQGSNAGFFDILWPGRYKGNTPDGGGGDLYTPGTGLTNLGAGGSIGLPPGVKRTGTGITGEPLPSGSGL